MARIYEALEGLFRDPQDRGRVGGADGETGQRLGGHQPSPLFFVVEATSKVTSALPSDPP